MVRDLGHTALAELHRTGGFQPPMATESAKATQRWYRNPPGLAASGPLPDFGDPTHAGRPYPTREFLEGCDWSFRPYSLNRRLGLSCLSFRSGEVDYLLTRFSNPFTGTSNQNGFRYLGGIIFTIHQTEHH